MHASGSSVLRAVLLLSSFVVCLPACGRLGYELHDLDAGADPTLRGATSVLPGAAAGRTGTGSAGVSAPRMDAGAQPTAANGSLPGAWIPGLDSGTSNTQPANGAACSGDDACASRACVGGICCESHCDAPPACYLASEASCETGQCRYVAAVSGARCDDGNSCTTGDRCQNGSCSGGSDCDDGNACTQDFCGPERCAHASTCQLGDQKCSYAERSGHGYWLCPGPVNFDAARTECKRIGAKLVTINDAREQKALWQLGMRDTWIGYRAQADDAADAGFDWVDGMSDFEAWADSDLDAGTADRCAFQAASEQGAWQARACDAFSGFACEVEAYAVPEASCRYQRRGSHGYFSCESQRTWIEAAQRCADSGAYLVEPDNAEEHAFVLTLLKVDASYAIGVTDAQREGQFVSTRGGRLSFSAWDKGEPGAASAELDYAVLTPSGVWQTVGSAQRGYYICEQER